MSKPRSPAWLKEEEASLAETYPRAGAEAALAVLPGRSRLAVFVRASKLGLKSPVTADAPRPKLHGDALDEAIRLREAEGWSFACIGAQFGVSEVAASNAVLIARCGREGHAPAERDARGHLTDAGRDRLRLALRKGLKGVDITLRLGVSAATIALERRRYAADLKARGKAALPAPGGGERYSGARLSRESKLEVERLLLTGLGGPKIAAATGVSKTQVQRMRAKLVKRLARKGDVLPGCDRSGRRSKVINTIAAVPEAAKEKLRALLLDGVPVARARLEANIGGTMAYRLRNALIAELSARGEMLPEPKRLGRGKAAAAMVRLAWLPTGRANLILYRRALMDCGGDEAAARRRTIRAIAERDGEDPRLAEQFDQLRRGATVIRRFDMRRADPNYTLGGVSTGAL